MRTIELAPTPSTAAVAGALAARDDLVWFDSGDEGFLVWGASDEVREGPDWIRSARHMLSPRHRHPLGFVSGLVGWLGYETGRWCERMPAPRAPRRLPDLCLRRYEGALHRRRGRWIAVGPERFLAEARAAVVGAVEEGPPGASGQLVDRGNPQRFLVGVGRVLDRIARGDCYQVNLARRILVDGVGDPLEAYLRLRRRSPASHGAYLVSPEGCVLSNSPELFLRVRDGEVESRPIKGTRPLGLRDELEVSAKERAELTMIVDLVRNDIGRVCVPGSVVAGARRIRELPTLLHAEQSVRGRLRGDVFDLVDASFPPGSVTGAPKVLAMSVIHDLEATPRGVYTGAIGWFDDAGDAELSVAIRTATVVDDLAEFHVGCGLVADSDPLRELEESDLKARALLDALVQPSRRAAATGSGAPRTAEITAHATAPVSFTAARFEGPMPPIATTGTVEARTTSERAARPWPVPTPDFVAVLNTGPKPT
ncbi:MAG TPA: anthranilate synthase component I family protein [Myxococcota bacterium]|nr:anthranilate synthase component I family protein [Myxococcota bacterium]